MKQEFRVSKKIAQSEPNLFDQFDRNDTKTFENKKIDDKFSQKDLDKIHELVLSKLGTMPVSIDKLIQELEISMSILSLALIDLELAGKIERVGSSQVMLII